MKSSRLIPIAGALIFLLGVSGCDNSSESKGDSEDTWPYQQDAGLVTKSPREEWRPVVTYSSDRRNATIALNTMCMNFHLETPPDGHAFTLDSAGSRDLLGIVSEMYEYYVNLAAYGYPCGWLSRGRELFVDMLSKSRPVSLEMDEMLRQYTEIESTSFEVSEKHVLDRIFQVTSWVVSDNLTVNDLVGDTEYASPSDFEILFSARDAKRLAALYNRSIDIYMEHAQALLTLAADIIEEAERVRSVPMPPPSGEPHLLSGVDILQARRDGLIEVAVTSAGGYNGRTMVIEVSGLSDQPTSILIPNGLRLGSGDTPSDATTTTELPPFSDRVEARSAAGIDRYSLPSKRGLLIQERLNSSIFPVDTLSVRQASSVQSMEGASSVRVELNEPEASVDALVLSAMLTSTGGEEALVTITLLPWTSDPEGRVYITAIVSGIPGRQNVILRLYLDEMLAGKTEEQQRLIRDNANLIMAEVAARLAANSGGGTGSIWGVQMVEGVDPIPATTSGGGEEGAEDSTDTSSEIPQGPTIPNTEEICESYERDLNPQDANPVTDPVHIKVSYCSRWVEVDGAWILWTSEVDVEFI